MTQHWSPGELVVRREVLGLQPGGVVDKASTVGVWMELPVFIVADTDEQLVSYTAPGAAFGFPHGRWPTPDGLHPWSDRDAWAGHGCLMMQRPNDHFAVWHFWDGPTRQFTCWYLNLQTAFVRTPPGYDTQDLELDIVVFEDGSYIVKDDDVLDERVAEGRFSAELVDWVRGYGRKLTDRLDSDGPWWDRSLAHWSPPDGWVDPQLVY